MNSTLDRRGPSAGTLGAWFESLLSHEGTDCGRIASSSFASASSIGCSSMIDDAKQAQVAAAASVKNPLSSLRIVSKWLPTDLGAHSHAIA